MAALGLVTLGVYWYIWLYRRYKEIRARDQDATALTPGRAVGLLFVPVFGAVWFFVVLRDLSLAIAKLQREERLPAKPRLYLVVYLLWLVALLLGYLVPMLLAGRYLPANPLWAWPVLLAGCGAAAWLVYVPYQCALNTLWTRRYHRVLWAEAAIVLFLLSLTLGAETVRRVHGLIQEFGERHTLEATVRIHHPDAAASISEREIERAHLLLQEGFDRFGALATVERMDGTGGGAALIVRAFLATTVEPDDFRQMLRFEPHTLLVQEVVEGPAATPFLTSDSSLELVATSLSPREYFVLRREAIVAGPGIEKADVEASSGQYQVLVTFSEASVNGLRAHVERAGDGQIAFVHDGDVIHVGRISREEELAQRIVIGAFSDVESAENLAVLIRSARSPLAFTAEEVVPVGSREWIWHLVPWSLMLMGAAATLFWGARRVGSASVEIGR